MGRWRAPGSAALPRAVGIRGQEVAILICVVAPLWVIITEFVQIPRRVKQRARRGVDAPGSLHADAVVSDWLRALLSLGGEQYQKLQPPANPKPAQGERNEGTALQARGGSTPSTK